MNKLQMFSALAGRVLIALIFFMSGLNKLYAYHGTQSYMESMGIPGFFLPLVIITEVGGSLAVVIGWQTKLAALSLAGFSILSAILFHANLGDQMQFIMFMKNISIAGGFLFLVSHGPGGYSLDNLALRKPVAV